MPNIVASWSCRLAFLVLAACGVDVDVESRSSDPALSVASPAPPDPFLLCPWHMVPLANQNVAFTGYGYWGDLRGFRIHHGNYDATGSYLEYKVEVIWSLPGCSGTVYYLRFPVHGLANHAEIEVRGAAGALKSRLVASKGSLPVLYNQAGVALPTDKRGPFVITSAMVGGGSGMSDTIVFTLLDAKVLTWLPYPAFYDGVLPASVGQQAVIASAYGDLIDDNAYLHSFFKFRIALEAMTATERQAASDSIDLVKDSTGPIHGDLLWEEHHHVDHAVAVGPAATGVGFGGFWNGHRNHLREIEGHLQAQPTVPAFGRVPAWDPAGTVPAEFAVGIDPPRLTPVAGSLSGGSDLEVAYRAANICASFDSSLSTAATLAERLADEEVALWNDVRPWHDAMHTGVVRGDMGPFDTSASVPLFYPWHTTVDTIWRNWQLCEAAYHPNRYSWDAL